MRVFVVPAHVSESAWVCLDVTVVLMKKQLSDITMRSTSAPTRHFHSREHSFCLIIRHCHEHQKVKVIKTGMNIYIYMMYVAVQTGINHRFAVEAGC